MSVGLGEVMAGGDAGRDEGREVCRLVGRMWEAESSESSSSSESAISKAEGEVGADGVRERERDCLGVSVGVEMSRSCGPRSLRRRATLSRSDWPDSRVNVRSASMRLWERRSA